MAIDANGAKVMAPDAMQIGYIRLAHQQGLGVGDPSCIQVVGDDISGENWGFSVGHNLVSRVGRTCWFGPLKWAQKLLFRTPLVWVFVFASECYHDWYRWPLKDRWLYRKWLKTQWGRTFGRYREDESLAGGQGGGRWIGG